MRLSSFKIFVILSISLFYGGIESSCHAREFRSDQLEEISRHVNIAWPDTDTAFTLQTRGHDITVRITDGCVEHIGFRLFPDEIRSDIIPVQIADFIERYWLSLTLPLKRGKSVARQMTEDRFVFRNGGINTVGALQRDTSLSLSFSMDDHEVSVAWGDIDRPVCMVTFPKNHELILGRKMLENDRRLPDEIKSALIGPRTGGGEALISLSKDSVTSLWVTNEGNYLDCHLKSDRYYKADEDGIASAPVFAPENMQESIANLFTGCDIEKADKIKLMIRHVKFGLGEQIIETTIPRLVAYCKRNGCVPFVGIVSADENEADVLVMMRNWQVGYDHLLRVSLPLSCIATGNGTSTARMNAFIPSSNIKNLFKD